MPRGLLRRARRSARRALVARARCRTSLPGGSGVAITFDDGPDATYTPQVLDVLAARGAHATFFLVGAAVTDHPELVRRIIADGHEVASHSLTHPDPAGLSVPALLRDYREGRRAVEVVTGTPVTRFRPPMGHVGGAGAVVMRVLRLEPWLWTVDPRDWQPGITADDILDRLAAVTAGDVVLLHDGLATLPEAASADRSATVTALPRILDLLEERGLPTVTLP